MGTPYVNNSMILGKRSLEYHKYYTDKKEER